MLKNSIKASLPIVFGYFPIAATFGILADSAGISIIDGVLMSVFVYAGASQFMAVSLIISGIGVTGIVVATFLMNFRHFIMSASIKQKLTHVNKKMYPIIGFFMTDETFSLLSMKDKIPNGPFVFYFQFSCYLSWVIGTLTGYIVGNFIPAIVIKSLGIALYALFVALIIPSVQKKRRAGVIAIGAGILNSLLQISLNMNQSFSFIVSVVTIAGLSAFFERNWR